MQGNFSYFAQNESFEIVPSQDRCNQAVSQLQFVNAHLLLH